MQLSTSMCWRISTNRGCGELPPTSKAKMLSLVLRAERVTGSPMFALQKGAPNLYLNPDAPPVVEAAYEFYAQLFGTSEKALS